MAFCSKCGANVADGVAFCGACGQPVAGYSLGQASPVSDILNPIAGLAVAPVAAYAGFWLRFVAALIDGIIISIPTAPIFFAVFLGSIRSLQDIQRDPMSIWAVLGPKLILFVLVTLVGSWLYWSLFESSTWQATPGKKILGLLVTDLNGVRITFGRASGRFFAGRGASSIPSLGGLYYLIDCISIAFTERKQAVHDMIAGCLVVRKA